MTSQRPAGVSSSYKEVCVINEVAEQHKQRMNPQELSEFVEHPASLDGPRLHDISGHDKCKDLVEPAVGGRVGILSIEYNSPSTTCRNSRMGWTRNDPI